MVRTLRYTIHQFTGETHRQWRARLSLHELTFSLHLTTTAAFHCPQRDVTGMAEMALTNARTNRRRETRQRGRWMCLKGRILGTSEFREKPGFHFWNSSAPREKDLQCLCRQTDSLFAWCTNDFASTLRKLAKVVISSCLVLSVTRSPFEHVFFFIIFAFPASLSTEVPQLRALWVWGRSKTFFQVC